MSDADADALEREFFGTKKYYSLTGSWIVRFAELKQPVRKMAILSS